jgi:hypothetical protein
MPAETDLYIEHHLAPGLGLHVETERRGRNTVVIVSCARCHLRLAVGTDLARTVQSAQATRRIRVCCR